MLHDVASAKSLVDKLVTYAEIEVTAEQRGAAVRILCSLPDDDDSLERFVKSCAREVSLASLADALRTRLGGPWKRL